MIWGLFLFVYIGTVGLNFALHMHSHTRDTQLVFNKILLTVLQVYKLYIYIAAIIRDFCYYGVQDERLVL